MVMVLIMLVTDGGGFVNASDRWTSFLLLLTVLNIQSVNARKNVFVILFDSS